MKSLALAAVVTAATALGISAQEAQIYKPGPGITDPVVVFEKKPSYTAAAMRARVQGSVEMEAVIDTAGKPTDIKVVRGLEPSLDKNAVEALEGWRFKPATKDGKAVPILVTIEMTFRLRDAPVTPSERVVEIEGMVGADGAVTDVRVVTGLTPELDMQAIAAFKASTFKPAMIEGRAVPYRVTMRFPFPVKD